MEPSAGSFVSVGGGNVAGGVLMQQGEGQVCAVPAILVAVIPGMMHHPKYSSLGVVVEFAGRNVGPNQVCRKMYVRIHPVSKIKQE